MKAKVLTWDEFEEVCYMNAYKLFNSGYSVDELAEDDIINMYSSDYFTDTTDTECDEFSSTFIANSFAIRTLEYLAEMAV